MRGVLFNNFWPVDHEIISFLVKANMRVLVARPRDWDKVKCDWQAMALPSGTVMPMQPQASEIAWDAKYVQTRDHWALGIHKMPVTTAERVATMIKDALQDLGITGVSDPTGVRKAWVARLKSKAIAAGGAAGDVAEAAAASASVANASLEFPVDCL